MDWMQIGAVMLGLMMLYPAWRGYQAWKQSGKRAEEGDWSAASFAVGGVILFVLLLILSVQ